MTVDHESTIDEPADVVEEKAAEAQPDPERPIGVVTRGTRWCAARWLPILLAVLAIASAALATSFYFFQFRPDQQTSDAAAKAAIKAASDGTVSLLSYSPESLDRDFATAKSHLTGNFLSYYSDFTQQIVTPAAHQKGVKTTANVVRAAVMDEMHPDSAVVLVLVNQSTVSKDRPQPSMAVSSVKVTLTKVNDSWLISSFDPV